MCHSSNMCKKRTRKVKKGSHLTRLREARRIQRLQLISSPVSTSDESNSLPPMYVLHPAVDKVAQNRVIIELAWKTVALMHKNKLIQQKLIDLQKETSEFVASVMNNPQNRQYCEHMRYGVGQTQQQAIENKNLFIKVEPHM